MSSFLRGNQIDEVWFFLIRKFTVILWEVYRIHLRSRAGSTDPGISWSWRDERRSAERLTEEGTLEGEGEKGSWRVGGPDEEERNTNA